MIPVYYIASWHYTRACDCQLACEYHWCTSTLSSYHVVRDYRCPWKFGQLLPKTGEGKWVSDGSGTSRVKLPILVHWMTMKNYNFNQQQWHTNTNFVCKFVKFIYQSFIIHNIILLMTGVVVVLALSMSVALEIVVMTSSSAIRVNGVGIVAVLSFILPLMNISLDNAIAMEITIMMWYIMEMECSIIV